jgi:acetyltransferase-like isoleucine patch superfamily enzyme
VLDAGLDVRSGVGAARKRGQVRIGRQSILGRGVLLYAHGGDITIGPHVFVGPYTVIQGHGNVTIGADTLIAAHCRILSSNHGLPPPGTLIRTLPNVLKPTTLGSDVWLGAGVTVLGGVVIGDGCVVGAGAVVTSDLPPYAVAVGVPAKVVKYRE